MLDPIKSPAWRFHWALPEPGHATTIIRCRQFHHERYGMSRVISAWSNQHGRQRQWQTANAEKQLALLSRKVIQGLTCFDIHIKTPQKHQKKRRQTNKTVKDVKASASVLARCSPMPTALNGPWLATGTTTKRYEMTWNAKKMQHPLAVASGTATVPSSMTRTVATGAICGAQQTMRATWPVKVDFTSNQTYQTYQVVLH